MNPAKPPMLATWMLEHLAPETDRDAVAGDLLEEYRAGRSQGWYWRQVIAAIVVGCARALRTHWLAVFFAVLWSCIPQSLLGIYFTRSIVNNHFMDVIYSLDWPYSTILSFGIFFGRDILSLWLGLALSLLADSLTTRALSGKGLLRGMLTAFFSYSPIMTAIAVLPILPGHSIDMRHVTDMQLLLDPRFMLYKAPFLLCLLLAAWRGLPRMDRRISKRILLAPRR